MELIAYNSMSPGDQLPQYKITTTSVQLFRFSAVTWNAHKIHYDKEYANLEGYPDIIVQAHLHGSFLTKMVTDWLGKQGIITQLEWKNLKYAIVGEQLVCKGVIKKKWIEKNKSLLTVELIEENGNREIVAKGNAVVQIFH